MLKDTPQSAEIVRAYRDYDRQVTVTNIQIGCLLGILLMPAGIILDYFCYRDRMAAFLQVRLVCSLLIGLFWILVVSPIGQRHCRKLGVTLAMFPAASISWMIYVSEGSSSPYYAGLNLVLLVIGFVLTWTFLESLVACSLTLAMYLMACYLSRQPVETGTFLSNLYFLVVTAIVVVTGSYFQSRFRFREFALRYQLDESRQQVEASNRKLTELDQIKSRFFANISHELRTPLTLLLAPLESLLHARHRVTDADTRSLLGTMHANAMRLLKLINDLLDLVRMESGRMEVKYEPLELHEFITGLASAARQVADDKRVHLETAVEPALGTVLVDRDKLEKILLNLLFNALKFTPGGGRVELRAGREGDSLALTVADSGMGIAAKHLPHVFDRFWQADTSSKRKYQGAGIGLALVKELTEVQGGRVSVVSAEGKGATFTVELPYRQAETSAAVGARPSPEAGASGEATPASSRSEEWLANLYRRAELFPALTPLQDTLRPIETDRATDGRASVLVADDEPDMLRFLKSQLSGEYQVLEAVDGQQAIEKASQFLPDIILLDMMMPQKDGIQACKELRQASTTQGIPIMMLTARADEETKLAALSAGASDFLSKPFSTTELHVRIRNLVEAYQLQRRLARQNRLLESTIEQLKETEVQLIQAEKIASLGRMSAGIIHEINNPLNFAATGLYTLKKQVTQLPEAERGGYTEVLRDVEEGLERVKSIVSDLRTFTHPDTEQREWVDVNTVLAEALRFLSSEWKGKIRIEQSLPEHLTLWTNRNRLLQLLLNLLQNSLDALRRKEFRDEEPTVWVEGWTEDHKTVLTVRDNGDGIEAKHLDRIFEPFFTTKDVGQGMGLGLSICHGIIQEHNGQVRVRSEPGRFAEFTIEFPAPEIPPAGSGP